MFIRGDQTWYVHTFQIESFQPQRRLICLFVRAALSQSIDFSCPTPGWIPVPRMHHYLCTVSQTVENKRWTDLFFMAGRDALVLKTEQWKNLTTDGLPSCLPADSFCLVKKIFVLISWFDAMETVCI